MLFSPTPQDIDPPPTSDKNFKKIPAPPKPNLVPEHIPSYKELNKLIRSRMTEMHMPVDPNPLRDRYSDVCPFSFNQVTLKDGTTTNGSRIVYSENLPQSAQYIAICAPPIQSIGSFIQMIEEENVSLIISLTDFTEGHQPKATPYLPYHLNQFVMHPQKKIACVHLYDPITLGKGWVLEKRDFQIQRSDGAFHHFTQLHLPHWKDHSTGTISEIHALVEYVFKYRTQHKIKTPIVVHCSAGIGRTGVFINSSQAYEQLSQGIAIDLTEIAIQSRLQRSGLGGRADQYQIVHEMLLNYERGFITHIEED